jgi:antibiotic biosynthesis monooxygenase (ABM) superfamily enzyme
MAQTDENEIVLFFDNNKKTFEIPDASIIKEEAAERDADAKQEKEKIKNEKSRVKLDGLKEYFEARKEFAQHIFTLVCLWLFFILIIVIASGKGNLILSDAVLITLITTTTVNVCGFLYVVAKFLFPPKK